MVFFTCNACGQAIKRAQVEKHYLHKCRNCEILSCVDCGKDFKGDAYLEHTKCVSEEEKYSGKNYKPKPGLNKGEKKQDAWLENVQNAIDNASGDAKVKSMLLQIKDCPNIPRKKQKFENFLINSLRIRDTRLISQAWERINSEIAKQTESKKNAKNEVVSENGKQESKQEDGADGEKKLNKREKKEERKKQANKKEKKDKSEENSEKKSKKRKLDELQENGESEVLGKKKTKKKHQKENEELEGKGEENLEEEDTGESIEERPKFKWDRVILEVLQSAKSHEISLKKLRKKVFAEFMASGGDGKCSTEEKMVSKFNKKLMKKTYWKIERESVKLIEQS